jgi:hypothetical protein
VIELTRGLLRIPFGLALGLGLCCASVAQVPLQPVQWQGSTAQKSPLKQGSKVEIDLSAQVEPGWHVYGLTQAPGGPTPLHVTLEENTVAQFVAVAPGTAPVKKHDPSFNLETEVFPQSFSLQVQAKVKQHSAAGAQVIPVSIRFQACSERECLPPRTVHLSVPLEIVAGT